MIILRRVWLALLVPLAVACGLHPLPDPLLTDLSEFTPHLSTPQPTTFLAEARIEYFGQGQARKGKATIMTAPDGRIRLDVLSFTDDLVAYLIVAGGEFRYFERGHAACFAGPFCAAPMVSRFPSLASPETLADVLQGNVPLLPYPTDTSVSFDRRQGRYVIRLTKGTTQQTLAISPKTLRVKEALLKVDGSLMLRVDYEDYFKVGDRFLPKRVRIRAPKDEIDLSVTFRDAEFGYTFAKDPFALMCPEGVGLEFLICPAEEP